MLTAVRNIHLWVLRMTILTISQTIKNSFTDLITVYKLLTVHEFGKLTIAQLTITEMKQLITKF